jgi:hypothetical protein
LNRVVLFIYYVGGRLDMDHIVVWNVYAFNDNAHAFYCE